MPYPEYLYLSISLLLVKLTFPNKQFSSAGELLILQFVTYLIKNIGVYYFSIKFYSYFITKVT